MGSIWAKIYFENRKFYKLLKIEISSINIGEEFCRVIDGTSFCAFLNECEAVAMTSFKLCFAVSRCLTRQHHFQER